MLRLVSTALAVLLLLLPAASAEEGEPAAARGGPLLFVQMADGVRFDGEVLTLEGVAPGTLFFSDRPRRLVGHMSNGKFVGLWSEEGGGFAADPPNAALVFLEADQQVPAVVELGGATLEGRQIAYRVRVLEGEIPAEGGAASLFVDHGGGGHGGGHGEHGGFGRGGDPGDRYEGGWFGEDWPGEYGLDQPYGQCSFNDLFDDGFSSLCF